MPEEEVAKGPTPLEGNTRVDPKASFEPERLSYCCADEVAAQIVNEVTAMAVERGQTIVVTGGEVLADLANAAAVAAILRGVQADYEGVSALVRSVSKPSPSSPKATAKGLPLAAAIQPVLSGAKVAAELLSYLRADVEYQGVETVVEARAFEIAVAARLSEGILSEQARRERAQQEAPAPAHSPAAAAAAHPVAAGLPAAPDAASRIRSASAPRVIVAGMAVLAPLSSPMSIAGLLSAVHLAKLEAWQDAAPMISEVARLDAELDRSAKAGDQQKINRVAAELAALRRVLDPIMEHLAGAGRSLDELQAGWVKGDGTGGLTPLARLLRAEALAEENPLYLLARVVASGGHLRTSRSLFRTMFSGDGVTSVGGVVVSWTLVEGDGTILRGGLLSAREGAKFPRPRLGVRKK